MLSRCPQLTSRSCLPCQPPPPPPPRQLFPPREAVTRLPRQIRENWRLINNRRRLKECLAGVSGINLFRRWRKKGFDCGAQCLLPRFASLSPSTYYKHPSGAEATRHAGAAQYLRIQIRGALIIGDRPNISSENECGPGRKSTKQTSMCLGDERQRSRRSDKGLDREKCHDNVRV